MTVSENVATALIAAGRSPDTRNALLTEVGLSNKGARPVTDLAYGDIKRVEMAMALAARPKVLLLDEPTAGMAGPERTRIMETVAGLADRNGTALLFTEHDMDAVFGFADRILVMDQGRLIADGAPDDIRSNAEVKRVYLGDADA
jgi:branched-chain amino acid transport system ATP-binding protein